jgi:hypothetical protein
MYRKFNVTGIFFLHSVFLEELNTALDLESVGKICHAKCESLASFGSKLNTSQSHSLLNHLHVKI